MEAGPPDDPDPERAPETQRPWKMEDGNGLIGALIVRVYCIKAVWNLVS